MISYLALLPLKKYQREVRLEANKFYKKISKKKDFSLKTTTVAITGASGFIGKHLSNEIKKIKNIELKELSRYDQSLISVSNYEQSPCADILIHLAQCNHRSSVTDEEIKTSLVLINKLLKKKYKSIVYISSGAVYGENSLHSHNTNEKIEAYDKYTQLKIMSESEILNYEGGVVARLSNVYGNAMSKSNVMSSILSQLEQKTPLQIKNQESIRDFIWVEDVVDGIIRIALKKYINNESEKIYNLSSGQGTSILKLTNLILEIANQKDKIINSQKLETENISCLIMDNKKSIDKLEWTPKIDLYTGISLLLKNFNKK